MNCTATFRQNNQINLLMERNQLLAQENAQLLQKLDDLSEKYFSFRSMHEQIMLEKNQHQRFYNIITFFFETSLEKYKSLENHPKYSSIFTTIQQATKSQITTTEKVNYLIQLASYLMDQHFGQYNKAQSEKLKQIQAKLKSRQMQRNKKIIQPDLQFCIVKDPSHTLQFMKQQNNIKEDVFYLSNVYQKCVHALFGQKDFRKIQKFQAIALKIKDLIIQRWEVRRFEANLALVQREFEVNKTGQTTIVQTVAFLEQSRKKLNKIRNDIDNSLKKLNLNEGKLIR